MNVSPANSSSRCAVDDATAVGGRFRGRTATATGRMAIRAANEIAMMRRAGSIVHRAIEAAARLIKPGITTRAIDEAASAVITSAGGESLFLGYASPVGAEPFPATTCISVNDEVVHGVPGAKALESGDIVTIDCGVRLDGWCADSAVTLPVGQVDPESVRLVEDGRRLLAAAVAMMRPGRKWSEIARVLEAAAKRQGYGIVRDYVGHGIGRDLHEPPQVPCFVTPTFLREYDFTLEPGMVLCVEPMLTLGSADTYLADDGWTVRTRDGRRACHVEHTIAVTRFGAEVLTDGRTE